MPSEIGEQLTSLVHLDLSRCCLRGLITEEIGNTSCLEELWLENNNFTALPSTLANLENLETLDLRLNDFDIDVPERTLGVDPSDEDLSVDETLHDGFATIPYEEGEVQAYLQMYDSFSYDLMS